MNYLRTGILLVVLTLLLVLIGQLIGGRVGASYAFIFALIFNFASYWFSDKIVLAMYRAKPLAREDAPEVYEIVEELIGKASLPMPRLFIIPQESPNAFATGRSPKTACVCITKGILEVLTRNELKGVLAHELAHVKNRDMLVMTMAAVIAGAIMMLADMARWSAMFGGYGRNRNRNNNALGLIVVMILAPIAAMLIQLAISRSREYAADASGAHFAMDTHGLSSALRKLQEASRYIRMNASPQTAHLFIVNPLRADALASLFSTHPPIEKRIKRLETMTV